MTMVEPSTTVTSAASACAATPTFKDKLPSFSSYTSSSSTSSSTAAMSVLTSTSSRSKGATADGTNGLVESSSSSSDYRVDSSSDRNSTITEALSVLDGQEETTKEEEEEAVKEAEDGESIADESGHSQYSRSSRRSRRSTRTSATCTSRSRCSTPPPISPRVGSVISPGSVRSRISAILHGGSNASNNNNQLQCPMSAPVMASSPSSSVRRSKKKIVFEGLGGGAAAATAADAGIDVPPLFALLHGGLDFPSMHSDGAAARGVGAAVDNANNMNSRSRSARMMTMMKPVRVTNKLKGKWPPVVKDDPALERTRRRREAIAKEMQQSAGHDQHTVQQRRVIFEIKSKQQQTLLLQQQLQDSSHEKNEKQKGQKQPTEQENQDDQHENGELVPAVDMLLPEEDLRLYDFVLPSGQRLPPPKRKGRKKRRRTNYRISYDGPTLLRLDEVYGPLTEIPEAEVDDDYDRFDNGSDRKLRRHGASCPVPPRRQRSFDHEVIDSDDEENNDGPLMLPCRSRDDTSHGGRDSAPIRPPRRTRSFDTEGDDDEFFHDYDDDTSLTEDEFFASVTIPPPPPPPADSSDSDQSLTEEDLNDSSKRRPDVWITPLMSDDGSRKWKVKRVWDVEDVDEEEPEYEVPHSNLMDSLRELLGVPEDFSAHSAEWDVEYDQFDPFESSAGRDSTPRTPKRAPYYITKIFDVDGEFDGSEDSLSFDMNEFAATMKDITATAIHDETVEEHASAPDENEQCMPIEKSEEATASLENLTTDSSQNQVGDESDETILNREISDENEQRMHIEKSEEAAASLENLTTDSSQNQVGDESDETILNKEISASSTKAPRSEKSCESSTPEPQPRLSYQERLRVATQQKKDSKAKRKTSVGSSEDKLKNEATTKPPCPPVIEMNKYSNTNGGMKKSTSFDDRPNYQPKGGWYSPISGTRKKTTKTNSPISGTRKKTTKPKKGSPDVSTFANSKKQQRKQKVNRKDDALDCETRRKGLPTWEKRPTGKKTVLSQQAKNEVQLWWHK